jgi:hypothetical protein
MLKRSSRPKAIWTRLRVSLEMINERLPGAENENAAG